MTNVHFPGAHFNEYGEIREVVLRHARDAFGSGARIESQWQDLNYLSMPDADQSVQDYDAFAAHVSATGAAIHYLPADESLTLDGIYVRDAAFPTPDGVVLCNMGKPARSGEPSAMAAQLETLGIAVKGFIEGDGRLEGGDVFWLDDTTVVVGEGYRTNAEGIRQLGAYLGPDIELHVVPLPHWVGPSDVFHLMSIISPIDKDLAVVYSRLMTVPFRNWLLARGIGFVEVPDEEFDSMGCNVLAIRPRDVVVIPGNPVTKERLIAAGVTVHEYPGEHISLKGLGGPTCLSRPLVRA
jgi:N-dimethylarginine dimethylaminohydrolase